MNNRRIKNWIEIGTGSLVTKTPPDENKEPNGSVDKKQVPIHKQKSKKFFREETDGKRKQQNPEKIAHVNHRKKSFEAITGNELIARIQFDGKNEFNWTNNQRSAK